MVTNCRPRDSTPSGPGALDACMTDFNALRREQRDAIVGPATDVMSQATRLRSGTGPRESKQRVEHREALRSARKRNRRR
jgi:hypothetical protein